jgi:hypothetical protein
MYLAYFLINLITLRRFSTQLRLRFHKRITKPKARHLLAQSSRHFRLCQFLFFALVCSVTAYPQEFEPRLQLSAQAGPIFFDNLYKFHHSGHYALVGSLRLTKAFQALLRAAYIPARQYFPTAVGARDAEISLYELAIGAKLQAPKFFSSRVRPFFSLTGGILLYRPQPVVVPIGLIDVQIDPPDASKPLLSSAAGIDWKLTKTIGLSLGFEASASRIAEHFIDGASRERWRPFYSAKVGITGGIK